MKRLLIIIINYSLFLPDCFSQAGINNSSAQESLGLQKACELAQQNYPLIKQRDLIKQTTHYTIDNFSKGFLPQLSLSGQVTYQSQVTEFDVPIQGFTFNGPGKDQYKMLADINQLIYDGGMIRQQKDIQRLNDDVEQQKIEVELYKIKDRINQIFLGILFLDEQVKQVELIKADLDNGIKRVEAQVNNGVAFRSNLNVLRAELLKADQRTIELSSSRKGLIDVLSIFINQQLPENVQLEKPSVTGYTSTEVQRPELKLFSSQDKLLGSQNKLVHARNLPKAGLFVQGGYGKPGLNFLQNEFKLFYTTGVRFNWSFGGLYTQKNEKKIIELNQKTIHIQRDVFLLNTNTQLKQQQSEIGKLEKLIATDKGIIDLRTKVKDAAKAQLENGVITANDYLREINAEDQARQSLITHQVMLLQAKINYQTISGKQ